jgi:hypothetical protein
VQQKETGFLLIKTFRKLVNPQNYGHQGSILGGLFFYFHLSVDIPDEIGLISIRRYFFIFYLLKKTHRTLCPTVSS